MEGGIVSTITITGGLLILYSWGGGVSKIWKWGPPLFSANE